MKNVQLDGTTLRSSRTHSHEIDMFGKGTLTEPLPGIAVEMEWNNKDPFYDRDLINFQALHREGAIAIGVIVTRGPALQSLIGPTILSKDKGLKYGRKFHPLGQADSESEPRRWWRVPSDTHRD